jgi:hypothetical protein
VLTLRQGHLSPPETLSYLLTVANDARQALLLLGGEKGGVVDLTEVNL